MFVLVSGFTVEMTVPSIPHDVVFGFRAEGRVLKFSSTRTVRILPVGTTIRTYLNATFVTASTATGIEAEQKPVAHVTPTDEYVDGFVMKHSGPELG